MIKHNGHKLSELVIATKITLFVAGDEIKIALAASGIPMRLAGLNIAAPLKKPSRLHTLGPLTQLEVGVINAQ